MGVKESRGDFFSRGRSLKESFYPKFLIKKFLQWPLKKGDKCFVFKRLLHFNLKLVYTPLSCRRLDLLFARLIYTGLFVFRSTNLTFIRRRLNKTIKKKIYGHIPYKQLEKSSIKLFSSVFNKEVLHKDFILFFLVQKYFKTKMIVDYRKKCYSSLTSVSFVKKAV
jgi:hypothetical protein